MVELQYLEPVPLIRGALTKSCGDLMDALLYLHRPEQMKEVSERRSTFARIPARSVSAPPRKKWFKRSAGTLERSSSSSTTVLCDEFTRKLVGAITTWHDIHSNLLRLSIDRSSSDSSISSRSTILSDEDEEVIEGGNPNCLSPPQTSSRLSISSPELTSIQIKQMFPELSEHWR